MRAIMSYPPPPPGPCSGSGLLGCVLDLLVGVDRLPRHIETMLRAAARIAKTELDALYERAVDAELRLADYQERLEHLWETAYDARIAATFTGEQTAASSGYLISLASPVNTIIPTDALIVIAHTRCGARQALSAVQAMRDVIVELSRYIGLLDDPSYSTQLLIDMELEFDVLSQWRVQMNDLRELMSNAGPILG